MGVVVQFDYQTWAARYPEFDQAVVTQPVAQSLFGEASIYNANDGGGPVTDSTLQLTLLNMLTAHLAFLYFGTRATTDAEGPAAEGGDGPLVGRVSSASEGSVSVQTQNDYPPGTVQWFQQTKYGASWWAATAPYRTMRYLTIPRRFGPNRFPYRWFEGYLG